MNKLFLKYTIFSIILLVSEKIVAQNLDQNRDDLSVYRVTEQQSKRLMTY